MPVLRFLSPDALAAMHAHFATTLLLEYLTVAATILVTTIPQMTVGYAVLSSSSNRRTMVVPIVQVDHKQVNMRRPHQVESLGFSFPGTLPDPLFRLLAGHTLLIFGDGRRLSPLHRWRGVIDDRDPKFIPRSGGCCCRKKAMCGRWGRGFVQPNTHDGCNGSARPRALFSFLFLTNVAHATAPKVPPSPVPPRREGSIRRNLGAMIPLELDLACSGMLLGEIVKFQRYFFWVSAKSGSGKLGSTSSHMPLPEL